MSAFDTALTVTVAEEGTMIGARYKPVVEMLPTVELPPVTPSTCQVTPVFDVFSTVAVNACVPPPALTLAVPGDTVTVTGAEALTSISAESCAPSLSVTVSRNVTTLLLVAVNEAFCRFALAITGGSPLDDTTDHA